MFSNFTSFAIDCSEACQIFNEIQKVDLFNVVSQAVGESYITLEGIRRYSRLSCQYERQMTSSFNVTTEMLMFDLNTNSTIFRFRVVLSNTLTIFRFRFRIVRKVLIQ